MSDDSQTETSDFIRLQKNISERKKNRAAFLPNLSVPDLAVQLDQSENEMRILIFILLALFQGLFEHSD